MYCITNLLPYLKLFLFLYFRAERHILLHPIEFKANEKQNTEIVNKQTEYRT